MENQTSVQASIFYGDARSLQTAACRRSCQLFPNCHCLPPQRGKAVHAVHATNSVIMSTHRQGTHTDCLQQHPPAIKTIKLLQSCSGDSLTHSLTLRVSGKKNIFSTSYCTHVQPHKPEHTQLFVLHFLTNVAYSNFFFLQKLCSQ